MAFATLDRAPRRPADWLGRGQNHGAVTCVIAGHDLLVNATEHAPGSSIARHAHADAYLCIVVDGGFEMTAARSIDCVAGSVLAHPEGHVHANRFGAPASRCVNIHLGSSWLQQGPMVDWLADFRHARLGPRAPSIRRLLREMRGVDTATPLALMSVAAELIADAMRAPPSRPAPPWLKRVVEAIEANLAQPPSLGSLAAEAGAHPSHLCRVFRASHGETIGEYVRRRRVEDSLALLASGELSIAEVASACGFADQSHYTRLFKRRFGITPGARRREMQRLS